MKQDIKIILRAKNYLRDFKVKPSVIISAAEEELALRGYSGEFEIEVVFAGNDRIRSLNKKYRKIDSPTDVLSFPLETNVPKKFHGALGSIVICPSVAKANIKDENKLIEQEISFLVAHSVDHLIGIHH